MSYRVRRSETERTTRPGQCNRREKTLFKINDRKIIKLPRLLSNVKNKSIYLDLIGILFLCLGILSVINSIFILHNPNQLLWFCYWGLIIAGIGMITRNDFLIASQLNILIVPFIIWNIDFFYNLIIRLPLLGLTDYFFISAWNLGKVLSLQHIITVPLALFGLYKIGIKRKDAWKMSIIQIVLFYLLTILITSPLQNVNCAFRACGNIQIAQGYPFMLLGVFIAVILLTNLVINKTFFRTNQPSRS